MPSLTPETRATLLARLRADQVERWRRGDRVRVEQYLTDHPEFADDPEAVLGLIVSEAALRRELGERPALPEYLGRFPAHAAALHDAWPTQARATQQAPSENGAPDSTVPDEPATPLAPRPAGVVPSLPGFEIHEKLGEGGMGVVYRARDVRLDRPRAIKVIRAGAFAGGEALDRFHREAKAVARLDHPGVVRIYALGEHDGTLYICMDYLDGGSLRARLLRGPMEPRAAAGLVRQLALAVQHAHDNNVLHRDLKPGNVLLTADGSPRVSDFGLAKLLDSDDDLTQSGAVIGTPSYMAPEQAEGRLDDMGVWTDVWSLGAILYECLVGRPPFKEEAWVATLYAVRMRPPVPPHQLRAGVPPDLEAVCLKCLEKQPARRYATAAGLADDLGNWLDGKPTRARPVRGLRRVWRGMRRRPWLSLLAGTLLLAGLTAAGLGYFGHPDRPLWQEQAQLNRGEPVELIGHTGKPRWSRWAQGEKDASLRLDAEGATLIEGWGLTLFELLPDTRGQTRFRLRAGVRHMKAGGGGAVGLYFARTTHRTTKVLVTSFLQVNFNDLQVEDVLAQVPEHLRNVAPRPKGNAVRLTSRYWADGPDGPSLNSASFWAEPPTFTPSGHAQKPGDWRSLTVEVTPEQIRVFWGPDRVATVNPSVADGKDRDALRQHAAGEPDNPARDGLVPRLDLGGGLGLYLYASSASFRDVRVEPLGGAGESNSGGEPP